MSQPIDAYPLNDKEPEPWDLAGAPPDVPFEVQEKAIEDLLHDASFPEPVAETPGDLAADFSASPPEAPETAAMKPEPELLDEAFKPTADEWENVKELLVPHPAPLDEIQSPAFRPEFLERDTQGPAGGGDWNEVETERTEDEPGTE